MKCASISTFAGVIHPIHTMSNNDARLTKLTISARGSPSSQINKIYPAKINVICQRYRSQGSPTWSTPSPIAAELFGFHEVTRGREVVYVAFVIFPAEIAPLD